MDQAGAGAGAVVGAGHSPARQSGPAAAHLGSGIGKEIFFGCVCPVETTSTSKR